MLQSHPGIVLTLAGCLLATAVVSAQEPSGTSVQKRRPPHRWVNPIPAGLKKSLPSSVEHRTMTSQSLNTDVGYCIYLPPAYHDPDQADRRFPVVYYLHGGRPGDETKAVRLAGTMHQLAQQHDLPPVIYVFVNGGPVSHYNVPDQPGAHGADVFIKELIPHIDQTFRTVADRSGRGLEGFSQGGRGTARLMFRYPELFLTAAPGGGGHATEQKISQDDGYENPNLRFAIGDNTWDLARTYAKARQQGDAPVIRILVHVGDQGFNYENNLAWMKQLDELGIDYEKQIVPGVGHSARGIYEKSGLKLMKFHADQLAQ